MRGLHRIVEIDPAAAGDTEVWINLEDVVSVREGEGSFARYTVINMARGPRNRYHVVEPAEQVVVAMQATDREWRG